MKAVEIFILLRENRSAEYIGAIVGLLRVYGEAHINTRYLARLGREIIESSRDFHSDANADTRRN